MIVKLFFFIKFICQLLLTTIHLNGKKVLEFRGVGASCEMIINNFT